MCSAIAIHLVLLAIGASAGNDLFDGLAFDHVGELMVEANDYRDIGWVQFGSCAEGDNSLEYPSGYTFEQLLELARYAVTVKFVPSSKLPTDAFSNSDDFTVYTELCSNPVYAFNHGYEMSFFLDIPSSTVSAQASTSEWIGTSTAKSRLANSCNDGEATPIADGGDVYHACGNGAGIHITQQGCWWSLNDYLGEDITIWMGFDASKAAYCDFDDYGEYQLFPYPETSIPATDSCLGYTFGFKTNSGADNFAASGGVHTITLFLDGNTMLQCEIAPSLTDTWYLCTAEGTGSNEAAYTRCEVDQEISPSVSQPVMQISNPTSGDNSEAIQVQLSITNPVIPATQFETLGALASAEVIGPNGLRYRQYFFTNNDGGQQSIEGVAPVAGDFVPVCSTVSEEPAYTPSPGESSLTFGIKTCSEHHGMASEEVKLSLYWHAKMYQCSVTPNQRGQWFSCEYSSADNDIECDAHNRVLDYALQVSTVNALSNDMDDSCIAEIYVREVVDGETVNEVELMVETSTLSPAAQWIGDSFSSSVSDSTNALYGPISTTSETCRVIGVGSRGEYDFCFHYEAVSVTIMACDGFTASAPTTEESVKMQLFGEGGTSRFLYVNSGEQTVLPENGAALTYDIDASVSDDLGELYRVKLSLDDTTAYCIQSLSVHVQNKSYHFSASEYFGSGVFLSSECSTTFMALPSSPSSSSEYIRCFDDYVTLNTYEARSVLEMTAHSCIGDASGASLSTLADSVSAAVVGKIDSSNGYVSEIVRLDTPSAWDSNVDRIYHLNLESYMDEVTVISITNDNAADDLCIDEVTIDDSAALYLSANFIGGTSSSTSTMSAIFEYPVCKTEVVGMRVDYEASSADILEGDASIAGLTCSNHNRLVSSTCSISQSYELSSTTSFAISNENSKTTEYSWGTESSVSAGASSSQSTTTSDEFSWGLSQEVEVEVDTFFVDVSVSVGSNQQWTSSTEEATESSTSTDTTDSQSSSNAAGSESSSGYESSYDTTATTSVECVAEFELPPSHSIQYSLIFNAFNTTINTYTDLKLTLCSAFLDPTASANDDSHYVYIDDIPGVINHKETTSCTVQFSPMEYLRNDMSCEEERSLSLSILSDFLPSCKPDGTYDGCQCDRDGTICWCVDAEGNKLNDASMTVEDGILWQEVCVNKLQCENSDVTSDNYLSGLEHSMDCATAQKLAIYKGDEYMPQCRIADSTAYDGCQCVNIGSSGNRRRCWCVTNGGANINGKAKEVRKDEGMSNEQVCVEVLQCEDSDVVYTAAVEVEPPSSNVLSLSLLSVAMFLSAVVVTMMFMCQKCMGRRQSSKVEAYDFVASSDDEQRALQ